MCQSLVLRPAVGRCERCIYWDHPDPSREMDDKERRFKRECHRGTPTAFPVSRGVYNSVWPQTLPEGWCGEYHPSNLYQHANGGD